MGRPIVHAIGFAIVATGFWALPGTTAAWMPFGNEVTVYMVSCDGEQASGTCRGSEKADLPFTYKVSVDQQSVCIGGRIPRRAAVRSAHRQTDGELREAGPVQFRLHNARRADTWRVVVAVAVAVATVPQENQPDGRRS